jgi:hypothetical protein
MRSLFLAPVLFWLGADASARTRLTFDYNWKFHLGDPSDVNPPLTAASIDPSFTKNISGMSCTLMAYAARRPVLEDCRGICSTTPGCLVWQYGYHNDVGPSQKLNSCFIHDPSLGNKPVCTPSPNVTDLVGESREVIPAPLQQRTGVIFKELGFDDSSWDAVDAPHDFIMLGSYTPSASLKHGYLPRNTSGWYRKHFTLPDVWQVSRIPTATFEGTHLKNQCLVAYTCLICT